jgi:invasion protein IalB
MTNLFRATSSLALCLASAAAPAAAQTAADAAWARDCGAERCSVSAHLKAEDRGSLFATIVVGFAPDGADPSVGLGVPLGVAVQPGVRLLLNGSAAIDVPVEVCLRDGCRAARALTADEARALATAESFEVRYFAYGDAAPLAARVSVDGLAEALAELR